MIYSVSARLIENKSLEFHQKLTDGTIEGQRPDGPSIVKAMERARIAGDGSVHWTENCYCATPLRHERATVYDRYFTDIEADSVDAHHEFDGAPLMDRLLAGSGG